MKGLMIRDAASVYNLLNGICCVYKPAGDTMGNVRRTLLSKISSELCELESVEPKQYVRIEGDTTKELSVNVFPSYAYNSLVMGPKYTAEDFRLSFVSKLGVNTSGILVAGLNDGCRQALQLKNERRLRTYRVGGRFGEAKHNLFTTGRTIDKGGYAHVKQGPLRGFLSSMQSSHQRLMFDLSGVDMSSQAAYDLAAGGLIRPANSRIPLIYSIKCVAFEPPDFEIEVDCVNEYEGYLLALIHDTGVKMRTVAHCTHVRCIRHSLFSLDDALLSKHWTLQDLLPNLSRCTQALLQAGHPTERLQPVTRASSVT